VLRSWFTLPFTFALLALSPVLSSASLPFARGAHWTELNIGPYRIDTESDISGARDSLAQMEQLRWVLGGLLETQDLEGIWPIRVVFTKDAVAPIGFEWQNGEYLLISPPAGRVPLGQLAGIFLDANTPRLPPEVETGMRELFSTLQARGSHVSWGTAPSHPDLAWARMQLFATRFEYGASFHIFLSSLKSGAGLGVAESNAFGKPEGVLEQEAKANLAAGNWAAVPVSGRPLDPKRDFGEQPLAPEIAAVYIARAELRNEPKVAEPVYRAAANAGGQAAALGLEGLAQVAEQQGKDPLPYLDEAVEAGSRSAPLYLDLAKRVSPEKALPLIKRAEQLNPRWAAPIAFEAKLSRDPRQREALLKRAVQLAPRETDQWIELAQVQTENGEASAAQGSWLRAAQSATDPAEARRIQQMEQASEQQRLDAEEAAARREREAAELEDEQAQQTEMERIRAAEEKANAAVDSEAGTPTPKKPIPWSQLVPERNLSGSVLNVECLRTATRISIRDTAGKTIRLLLPDELRGNLACGSPAAPLRVRVSYAAQPDDSFHTAGKITRIELR
jgi:hypothetical protein